MPHAIRPALSYVSHIKFGGEHPQNFTALGESERDAGRRWRGRV